VNLIALRCLGPIGLYSFVAIRRRQRGQITIGCFGRGPMTESETHSCKTCQSGEDGQKPPGRCEPSWKVSDPSWRKLLPHSQASYSRSLPAISRHCWARLTHICIQHLACYSPALRIREPSLHTVPSDTGSKCRARAGCSSSAAIFAKILGFRGPATPGWGV
jgi:hypothetical protein